jgi:acetyltransferase-like isoleucine patch superfamily enzyme
MKTDVVPIPWHKAFLAVARKNRHLLSVYARFHQLWHIRKQISGKGNSVALANSLLKNTTIRIRGNANTVRFGRDVRAASLKIRISGDNHTVIVGNRCRLGVSSFHVEDSGCIVSIGEDSTVENAHFGAAEPNRQIVIGNDCMLSSDIYIATTDSHSIIDIRNNRRINPPGDVQIGNHVWIGAYVRILKGVTIESGSIVGLGSVVNDSIPADSIAVGVPARVVKSCTSWKRDRTQ